MTGCKSLTREDLRKPRCTEGRVVGGDCVVVLPGRRVELRERWDFVSLNAEHREVTPTLSVFV